MAGSKLGSMEADFDHWCKAFIQRVQKWNSKSATSKCQDGSGEGNLEHLPTMKIGQWHNQGYFADGCQKTSDFDSSEEEDTSEVSDVEEEDDLVDLEDLGKVRSLLQLCKKSSGFSRCLVNCCRS